MKLSLIAFTTAGANLMAGIIPKLEEDGHVILEAYDMRGGKDAVNGRIGLHEWTEKAFSGDGIIFVGACGIAVRAIAPFVKDKLLDPAVVVIDERGQYVIPLLSGHVGGANALAFFLADRIEATAVITTATDVNKRFAVDLWAAKNEIQLCEREIAKAVSAKLLDGKQVGFVSDFPIDGDLPYGLATGEMELGICVSLDMEKNPFARTLHAIPRILTLGVGCRRDVESDMFERTVLSVLNENHVSYMALRNIATIDIKSNETCIINFCEKYGCPLDVASAETLSKVRGDFTPSEFVTRVTGVDNVCERAAVLVGKGKLIIRKQCRNAVTIAAVQKVWRVCFEHSYDGNRLSKSAD